MKKMTRKDKTTLLYVLLCVGTAAAAFLCVLVSNLLLKAEERRLYDRPGYESFTLESGIAVGAPLSLSTRVELFNAAGTEGRQRNPLPDELTEGEANADLLSAWSQLMSDMMTQAGSDPELNFEEILAANGLKSPFEEQTIIDIINAIVDYSGVGYHVGG